MTVRLPKDEGNKVSGTGDIARIMQKVLLRQNKFHRNKEYFWTIGLNVKNDIEYIELVSIGTRNRNILEPVDVFGLAVSKKCNRIIFCHNHPSGDVTPSKSDRNFTEGMKQAGAILKIELLEHIVISEKDYTTV